MRTRATALELLRLPAELQSEVVRYLVDPEDLINFACVGPETLGLVTAVGDHNGRYERSGYERLMLQNRRFRVDYRFFRVPYAMWIWGNAGVYSTRTVNMLCSILANARISYYIRRIVCQSWQGSWLHHPMLRFNNGLGTYVQVSRHTPYSQAQFSILRRELVDTFQPQYLNHWIQKLHSGNEDAVMALLLLKCPNITRLDFHEWNGAQLWKALMLQVAAHIKPTVPTMLRNLRCVYLRLHRSWDAVELVGFAGTLPSIETIALMAQSNHLYFPRLLRTFPALPPGRSNAKRLFLEADLSQMELRVILANTQGLETLGLVNSYNWPFDLVGVRELLIRYMRDSLRRLALRKRQYIAPPPLYISDFAVFHKLGCLDISLILVNGRDLPQLAARMPLLKKLKLRDVYTLMHEHAKRVIRNICKTKLEKSPR